MWLAGAANLAMAAGFAHLARNGGTAASGHQAAGFGAPHGGRD